MEHTASRQEINKIRDLIKDIRICMFSTTNERGRMHSRPMYTQKVEFDGDLWFFTYLDSNKVREINIQPQVNVSFSEDNEWVSCSGPATLSRDRAKIDELWRDDLKAFFPKGKDDPNLALLKIEVEEAEYWDSPSSAVVRLYGFAKSRLTGKSYQEEFTEHEKVQI
jgi:general stress protein 26